MALSSQLETQTCVICLMGFMQGEESYWMQCTHRFHKECISNFAEAQKMDVVNLRCPTCKTPSCSDEDAMLKMNESFNTLLNFPDQPIQAINLEETQDFEEVDLADTAVDLVDTEGPEAADSTEPAEDSSDSKESDTTPADASPDSQASDMAPLLEVTAREHKRRLEAGLRTESIAKKCKPPPVKKDSTKRPRAAGPLTAIAEANSLEADLRTSSKAYGQAKMAKLLGANPPTSIPAKAKAKDVAKPTDAEEPKPKPAVPKPSKSTVVMVAEIMHVPSPTPTCSTDVSQAPQLLQCDKCGSCVSRDLARVLSKKAETYKCGKCASTMTQLYRRPGGLPSDKTWSKEKKNEFWQLMHSQHNAESMDEVTNRFTQSEYKKDESHYDNSGEFLPLSVWTQRGFNAESIETNSSDSNIRFDPVLGKIYRVVIQSSGHRGVQGAEEQRQHCLAPGAPGATATAAPKAAPTLAFLKAEVEKVEKVQAEVEKVAKLQTRKIANLDALCNQITSMCRKNPEMVPKNITEQADTLTREADEIKIQASTSDVTKASHHLSLYLFIYIHI